MKILITYDSVSPNRNTEKIANAMGEVLRGKGFEVDCPDVTHVDNATVKNYDCVIAGSPTMAFSATIPIKEFLEGFAPNEFSGKFAAAFDTRVKSRLSGAAAKGIQKRLEKLGFKIAMPSLAAYVEGSTGKNDFQLKEGELEKAKKFAEDFAQAIQV